MLSLVELKTWLHRDLSQKDKILLLLAVLDKPVQVSDLKRLAAEAGFRIPPTWNASASLRKAKGLAIRTPSGWEITDAGKQHLRNLGVIKFRPAATQVVVDLRAELQNIRNDDTKHFVEESIKCFEFELYRSAIVMSWLASMHVIHNFVFINFLKEFNDEAKRVDAKWRDAKSLDDFGRMAEGEFLERIVSISIIGKNVKKELKDCLDRRNGCGHPNSLKVGANTAVHHLEILLLNVFKVF